jgi:glycosidase
MPWGEDQDRELFEHVQGLIEVRRSSPALRRGSRRTLVADDATGVYVFARELDDERVIVAANASDEARTLTLDGARVEVGPLSAVVVRTT